MNIAIVNNETRFLSELVSFAEVRGQNKVSVFNFNELDLSVLESQDLIILSGAYKDPVALNPDKYAIEIKFIRTTSKPVLGTCMGFEIIAFAFGSELERMHNKESHVLELKFLEDFSLPKDLKAHEHHRWHIKSLGSDLVGVAESKDGIEIIRHRNKPIYGFQFHPELDSSTQPILKYISQQKPRV